MNSIKSYFYSSPIGILEIQLKDNKLYSLSKVRSFDFSKKQKLSLLKKKGKIHPLFLLLKSRLNDYFSGKRIKIKDVPLYSQGTSFQKKVWKYLSSIPYGECCTYAETAQAVGSPRAFRAVGSACGKNPWLILVPCHRVVGRNSLGGFALGLKVKSYLLDLECKK